MPAADPDAVVRAGGRLFVNPSNLRDVPAGLGTELGAIAAARFKPRKRYLPVVAEELGAAVDLLYLGEAAVFSVVLRQFAREVLATVFDNVAPGPATGGPVVSGGGAFRPGSLLSQRALTLLFQNRDAQGPSLLIPQAAPALEESAALNFELTQEQSYAAIFVVLPQASGPSWHLGRLEDLAAL